MTPFVLILLVLGFACFVIETIRSRSLIAAGLAFCAATFIIFGTWPTSIH